MNRESSQAPIISLGKAARVIAFALGVAAVSSWANYPVLMYIALFCGFVTAFLYFGARTPVVSKCVAYLAAVYSELQNCKWPEWADVYKAVLFVLWSIIGLAGYLFVVDLGAIEVLERTGVVPAARADVNSSSSDQ